MFHVEQFLKRRIGEFFVYQLGKINKRKMSNQRLLLVITVFLDTSFEDIPRGTILEPERSAKFNQYMDNEKSKKRWKSSNTII